MALFRRRERAELAAWTDVQIPADSEDTWTDAIRPTEHTGRQPYETPGSSR